MEILVISHKYPPSIGGMQTHCYKLVQELKKQHRIHDLIWKSNYPRLLFFLTVVVRTLIKLRTNKNIKVIYINDGLMALVCTPLLFFTKVPMVVTIHGLDINFPSRFYQNWAKKYLNRFSRIIAVSEPTRTLCIAKGLLPEKITLVENAVDIHFQEEPDEPNFKEKLSAGIGQDLTNKFMITSLGRAIPRKGFNWFARNVVPLQGPDVVYIVLARDFPQEKLFRWIKRFTTPSVFEKIRLMVGAEIDVNSLNQTIEELNLQNRVVRLGQFTDSRSKLFKIIKYSDLFVMPNIAIEGDYEGFGLVALEAASQGTLTLAAAVDGIPSAVKDHENGYLIAPGNAQEWATKINSLKSDPQLLEAKAKTFQHNTMSKNRSWETMALSYQKAFEEVSN